MNGPQPKPLPSNWEWRGKSWESEVDAQIVHTTFSLTLQLRKLTDENTFSVIPMHQLFLSYVQSESGVVSAGRAEAEMIHFYLIIYT